MGRIGQKQMNMILVRLDGSHFSAHIRGDGGENLSQKRPYPIRVDRVAPILCSQDQVRVQAMRYVPS